MLVIFTQLAQGPRKCQGTICSLLNFLIIQFDAMNIFFLMFILFVIKYPLLQSDYIKVLNSGLSDLAVTFLAAKSSYSGAIA